MGFGCKTSWPAVQGVDSGRLVDALDLRGRVRVDWDTGTEAAYRTGVHAASPVAGWTPAHGRVDLAGGGADLVSWLGSLGKRLGDLQYFCTEGIGEHHAWARVESGRIVRACCYDGTSGDVPVRLGEPTDVERCLGVGHRWLEEG